MIIIMGMSCTGKDTIVNELKKRGYGSIVMHTTRPIREGEKEGVNYYYVSKEEFERMQNDNELAEQRSYDTEYGTWYYGTSRKAIDESKPNSVYVATPECVRSLLRNGSIVAGRDMVVLICADKETITKRAVNRPGNVGADFESKMTEARRRYEHDVADFKDADELADITIKNNDGTSLLNIVFKIQERYEYFRSQY